MIRLLVNAVRSPNDGRFFFFTFKFLKTCSCCQFLVGLVWYREQAFLDLVRRIKLTLAAHDASCWPLYFFRPDLGTGTRKVVVFGIKMIDLSLYICICFSMYFVLNHSGVHPLWCTIGGDVGCDRVAGNLWPLYLVSTCVAHISFQQWRAF